jgi:hypothetical protein
VDRQTRRTRWPGTPTPIRLVRFIRGPGSRTGDRGPHHEEHEGHEEAEHTRKHGDRQMVSPFETDVHASPETPARGDPDFVLFESFVMNPA